MSYRRKSPTRTREVQGGLPSHAGKTNLVGSHSYAPPRRTFDLGALCPTCPPLVPIKAGISGSKGNQVFQNIRPDGEPASYAVGFADSVGNTLTVRYKDADPFASNDQLVERSELIAERCGGPVRNALGQTVCGASGLICDLMVRDERGIARPEALPAQSIDGIWLSQSRTR